MKFTEFEETGTTGFLRFATAEDAQKVLSEKKEIAGKEVKLSLLQGEEEDAYIAKVKQGMVEKGMKTKKRRGKKRF